MLRNRTTSILLLTLAALACLSALADDRGHFSQRDLRGSYAFEGAGQALLGGVSAPVAVVGRIEADGAGAITFATRTINLNGRVVQNDTAVGTYTVQPDGRGSGVFLPTGGGQPVPFDFVLHSRDRVSLIPTDPTLVAYIEMFRQRP